MTSLQMTNNKKMDSFIFDSEIVPKELQIRRTKNYAQFKTIKGNRTVKMGHVNELVKAINKNNLLPQFVSVVTKDGYLVDGQHRLKACEANDFWFYFTIIPESVDDIIVALVNSVQLRWRPIDWVNFFADRGYPQYVWIRETMVEYKLSLVQIVYLLKSRIDINSLRNGKLTFFTTEEEKIYCHDLINAYLDLKDTFDKQVWTDSDFCRALRIMFQQMNVEQIKAGIEKWGKIVSVQNDSREYLRLFEEIMNKGKHEKSMLRFF